MRACQPVRDGYAGRGGVKLYYEVYGSGEPTVVLLPTWSIIHSRHWKMQIPYLARHCRVVTFDGRGNGRSGRPQAGYDEREFAADALAVMDATGTGHAVIVSLSLGAQRALLLAAGHPDRVAGAVFNAPYLPLAATPVDGPSERWDEELSTYEGWAKYNRHYWLRDYRGFLEFFFSQMFTEPHSTKPAEDCVGWGLDTTAETLVAAESGDELDEQTIRELCRRIRCPVLVIQGTDDAISGKDCGIALAAATGGQLVLLDGAGHGPHVRDPVKVNLLLRDFAAPPAPPSRWARGRARRKRALYISSPIGLGHAQRDAAIADELRTLHPGLEIDWLAQHPVTKVLAARGERIHPASACLASESGHIKSESAGHDLHAFQAIRRMDEILLANFMVFHDLAREQDYDLWIGDEAWELTSEIVTKIDVKRLTDQAAAELSQKGFTRIGGLLQGVSGSLASGVAGFVHSTIHKIITGPRMANAWTQVNRVASQQLVAVLSGSGGKNGAVGVKNGQVTLDIAPLEAVAKQDLVARGLTIAGKIPIVHATVALFPSKNLVKAQKAYRLINGLKIVLPILTLVLLGLGVLAARGHRRALIGAGLGFAASMLVLGAGLVIARALYLNSVPATVPADAAAAAFDILVRFIKTALRTLLVVGLVVAVGAFFTGPSAAAVRTRHTLSSGLGRLRHGGQSGPASRWTYAHRHTLRIGAVALAALIFVFWGQPTAAVVVAIAVLLLVILGLIEVIGRPPAQPSPAPHAADR
jgi:pimeloyl-ACP methyl ester carboxylesterase